MRNLYQEKQINQLHENVIGFQERCRQMVEIVRAKKASKELPSKRKLELAHQGQGLDDETLDSQPPTLTTEQPLATKRDFDKVSDDELSQLLKEV